MVVVVYRMSGFPCAYVVCYQALYVLAKFDYQKKEGDELSITKGDRIRVRRRRISLIVSIRVFATSSSHINAEYACTWMCPVGMLVGCRFKRLE